MIRKSIASDHRQKIGTLLPGTAKSAMRRVRKKPLAGYRIHETVRTARGEGVIRFVFTRILDGKTSYSVNFPDKRLSVIFHENELARCLGKPRHV